MDRAWPQVTFLVAVITTVVMFIPLCVVAAKRDELAKELELEGIRLKEARLDCRRPPALSCNQVSPSSGLWMCTVPGERFTWLAWSPNEL